MLRDEDLLDQQHREAQEMDQARMLWDATPEQALNLSASPAASEPGLGLGASQGTEQPRWLQALKGISGAVEAFGAGVQGREPLFLKQMQLDQQQQDRRQQMQDMAAYRKQALANQIAQQQEAKRQHNWGIAEKLITSGNMGALEEFGKQFPDVMPIVQGVSKQHLSSLPVLAKGGYLPQDIVQRVMSPNPDDQPMTPSELSMHVKLGMENWQADIKEQAKSKLLTDSLNTPAEQRKPHQQLLVDEHQKKLEVQSADIDLKKAQAEKLRKEQEGGNDKVTQTMNGLARGIFGKDAREVQSTEMINAEDRLRIQHHGLSLPNEPMSRLTALSVLSNVQVPRVVAGLKATEQQKAQLAVPDKPSASERTNLIDDAGTLSRIDSLMSLYNDKYVGPIRGRIGATTEMFGGITEDEADFRAENATLRNQVIKLITGAQMSEPEAKRIMRQVPDENNPPAVYEARLKRTRENVSMMAKKRREILQQSGIDVSGLAPLDEPRASHPAVKSVLDEVLGQ